MRAIIYGSGVIGIWVGRRLRKRGTARADWRGRADLPPGFATRLH